MKQFPVGLAYHQIPRKKEYQENILPPVNCLFINADADGQETRLMADASSDSLLIDTFRKGLNPHAITSSMITGIPYNTIMEGKKDDEVIAVKYLGGKVTDLGENYRMGTTTLWRNAHTEWGLVPTIDEVQHWRDVWLGAYKGVKLQWGKFIQKAQLKGYAETLAGRRFYINQWGSARWKSESSAIMFPIQGTGAEMKYLAIAILRYSMPVLTFWGEKHDAVTYYIPRLATEEVLKICHTMKQILNNLPYEKSWGWKPKIPFTWTVSWGENLGKMEEVK